MIKTIQIPKGLSHLFTGEMLVYWRKWQPRKISSRPLIVMLWIETQREPSLILLRMHLTGSHNQSLTLESIRNKISHTVIRGIISLVTCMAFCNPAATFPPLPWAFSWSKNQNSNQKCEGHTSESITLLKVSPFTQFSVTCQVCPLYN